MRDFLHIQALSSFHEIFYRYLEKCEECWPIKSVKEIVLELSKDKICARYFSIVVFSGSVALTRSQFKVEFHFSIANIEKERSEKNWTEKVRSCNCRANSLLKYVFTAPNFYRRSVDICNAKGDFPSLFHRGLISKTPEPHLFWNLALLFEHEKHRIQISNKKNSMPDGWWLLELEGYVVNNWNS